MIIWAAESAMPIHVLLTKADKLKRGPALNTMLMVGQELQQHFPHAAVSVQLFSALKRVGVGALEEVLTGWYRE